MPIANTPPIPHPRPFRSNPVLSLCSLCALCFKPLGEPTPKPSYRLLIAGLVALLMSQTARAQHAPALADPITVDGHTLAVPTPVQAAWQDMEVGMFVHLAP